MSDTDAEIAEIRANYAALVAMCDNYFGQLLDFMDLHDMWSDTALILTTDHGLLLSEHDWWGKNLQPYYREISHIPLIVHDPRKQGLAGTRVPQVTQTHDLMPTFLELHDTEIPKEVQGHSVLRFLETQYGNEPRYALFSMFGGPMGISDGEYDYYLYPRDIQAAGLHEYTLMPTHLRSRMVPEELASAELDRSFTFTKGAPVLKIDALTTARRIPIVDRNYFRDIGTRLFHTAVDPGQKNTIEDVYVEERMTSAMLRILSEHECPSEFYDWFGLSAIESQDKN